MQDVRIILACVFAASVSAITLDVLARSAKSLGLVDIPDSRKIHSGNIPLVGGFSIFAGTLVSALWLGGFPRFSCIMLATAAILVLLGALDDRFNLGVCVRLLVQAGAVLGTIACTGVYVHSFGHLFGQELTLGWMGIPFTVIAIIGLLNAFNMMDGIDGLAGGLSLVTIVAILSCGGASGAHGPITLMLLMCGALVPFLAANLGLVGRKVFLGDAGSMLLGYLLAWALIEFSQATPRQLSPIDVLWYVALPVLDTLAVAYRRLRQGKSPLKPDRGHIHHIVMRAGLGPRRTLACLLASAAVLAFFGTVIRKLAPEASLLAFGILTVAYVLATNRAWIHQEKRMGSVAPPSATSTSPLGIGTSPLFRPGHE
jgi:UDP-GlcNAc:undecaprenyl-phosphate GlcNAc-1-phosphate transferase